MSEMKTLTVGGKTYEIVDEKARRIEAVRYTQQSLTAEQQEQTRKNIGIELSAFANALKGSASGAAVAVRDVYWEDPALRVQLSSNTITDFSGLCVSVQGKNLWPKWTDQTKFGATTAATADGGVSITGTASTASNHYIFVTLPPGTYTLSAPIKGQFPENSAPRAAVYCNGKVSVAVTNSDANEASKTFTLLEKAMVELRLLVGADFAYQDCVIYPQIEIGIQRTPFEAYKEPVVYIANADGLVENVDAIAPAMSVCTDADGVIVQLQYNKDVNKAVADITERIAALEEAIINS